jgi:signal transduction histidine kinase
LSDWAAIAIGNSRLYRDVRQRRDELQRANRVLETTAEIGRALGGVTDLDRVLELVVKRSRALIDARATELVLVEGDEFVVAAAAGTGVGGVRGTRLKAAESIAGLALRTGKSQRIREISDDVFASSVLGAKTALVTPMLFRNRPLGYLSAFDRTTGDGSFSEEDERLLQAFAASAASAVATAQSASNEALQRSVRASEDERQRWARELHDETLQELAGLKVLLSAARRSDDPARLDAAVDQAIGMITSGIANLRALITDLRPAALDELGTKPAVEALVERVRAHSGLEIDLEIDLAFEEGRSVQRHAPEVEVAVYRLVQEALTNVVKHSGAERAAVRIADPDDDDGHVLVEIHDDGKGFDPENADRGFGLLGMRERVALVQGELDVRSAVGEGTAVTARIPVARRTSDDREPVTPAG